MWMRTQTEQNAVVQNRCLQQLNQAAEMLMLPVCCYHEVLKEEFENPATYQSHGPCGTLCLYYTGAYNQFLGAVSRTSLVAVLML